MRTIEHKYFAAAHELSSAARSHEQDSIRAVIVIRNEHLSLYKAVTQNAPIDETQTPEPRTIQPLANG